MKEMLTNNGWIKEGGCNCQGGADFYTKEDKPNYRIEHFYKANFWTLSHNFKRIKKGTVNDLQQAISEI